MSTNRVYVIDMVKDLIEDLIPKKAFSLSHEDHGKIRDIEFDFQNKLFFYLTEDGTI